MSDHAILRALSQEPMTTRQLQARLSATLAKPMTEAIVLRLCAQGKIAALKGGKWQPTAYGLSLLPSVQSVRDFGKYVPPKVLRRPGSDRCATLPSRVAGRLVYPQRAGTTRQERT